MKQRVWENVHKPAGMHVKNYVPITVNGHAVLHVELDVITVVQWVVLDAMVHANHTARVNQICMDVPDVALEVDVLHHANSIVIRIVLERDVDHYAE